MNFNSPSFSLGLKVGFALTVGWLIFQSFF